MKLETLLFEAIWLLKSKTSKRINRVGFYDESRIYYRHSFLNWEEMSVRDYKDRKNKLICENYLK